MLDQLVRDYTNSHRGGRAGRSPRPSATCAWPSRTTTRTSPRPRVGQQGARRVQPRRPVPLRRATPRTPTSSTTWPRSRSASSSPRRGEVREAEPSSPSQRETVEKLKSGLAKMKDKLGQLKSTPRHRSSPGRSRPRRSRPCRPRSARSTCWTRPARSRGSRRRCVARRPLAIGQAEIAASSLDAQFAELEASGEQIEVEARLAALKSGSAAAAAGQHPGHPGDRGLTHDRDATARHPSPQGSGPSAVGSGVLLSASDGDGLLRRRAHVRRERLGERPADGLDLVLARGVGGEHGVGVDVVVPVGPAAQRRPRRPRGGTARPTPSRSGTPGTGTWATTRARPRRGAGRRPRPRACSAAACCTAVRQRRDGADDGVAGRLGTPAHVDDAGLAPGRGRHLHAAAAGCGEQLGAEADAERGDALGARVGQQRAQLGQPRGCASS